MHASWLQDMQHSNFLLIALLRKFVTAICTTYICVDCHVQAHLPDKIQPHKDGVVLHKQLHMLSKMIQQRSRPPATLLITPSSRQQR